MSGERQSLRSKASAFGCVNRCLGGSPFTFLYLPSLEGPSSARSELFGLVEQLRPERVDEWGAPVIAIESQARLCE